MTSLYLPSCLACASCWGLCCQRRSVTGLTAPAGSAAAAPAAPAAPPPAPAKAPESTSHALATAFQWHLELVALFGKGTGAFKFMSLGRHSDPKAASAKS